MIGALHQLTAAETVIRRLYTITHQYDEGFERQVDELLQLGCDRFDMDIGILSRIRGDKFSIVRAVAPGGVQLLPGETFGLAETYCSLTVESDAPTGFLQASQEIPDHFAFGPLDIEAYIGVPVQIEGELYGTLSFSSRRRRKVAYEGVDVDSLMLMQSWITGEIGRRRQEERLRDALSKLEHLAIIDPLTELLNRRGVSDLLDRMMARQRAGDPPLSAVFVDLDDFKHINDNHGHSTGDLVLTATANAIRLSVRPTDIVARIGGDEFLVLLPGATEDNALMVGQRICAAVGQAHVESKAGQTVTVTSSVGATEVPGASTLRDILLRVEDLMKASKRAGKNTVSSSAQPAGPPR